MPFQIREVAKEERVILDGELKTMLEFYHDLGVIVHYGGASTLDTTLQNTVILQPQWLVDMFKQVITVQAQPQEVRHQQIYISIQRVACKKS